MAYIFECLQGHVFECCPALFRTLLDFIRKRFSPKMGYQKEIFLAFMKDALINIICGMRPKTVTGVFLISRVYSTE